MSASTFMGTVRFALLLVPFLIGNLGGSSHAVQAATLDEPSAFVKQLGDKTIDVLTNDSLTDSDRMVRYRALLKEGFAVRTIARFALGRYWRGASPAQRDEYLELFQKFVLDTYSKRLNGFSGQSFNVIKSQGIDDKDTMVLTEIGNADGPAIRVDYRVRAQDGKFKIVDVLVEGISLIVTQRSEFASVINRDGIEGLIEKLRRYTTSN